MWNPFAFKGTKADQDHKRIIKNILFGKGIKNPETRPVYKDGTSALSYGYNGEMFQYDLSKDEFPIITLRPIAYKSAIKEIFWIYQDQSNSLNVLEDKYNIHWWNDWDIGDRTIGTIYGHTVKRYELIDRLLYALDKDPYSRRHIMSLWQEDELRGNNMVPCAYETLWNVRYTRDRGNVLDMTLIQRSCDTGCALSINQVQYCALLYMVARCIPNMSPGVFTHFVQNIHIYERHMGGAMEMLERKPVRCHPKMMIKPLSSFNFYELKPEDILVLDYPIEKIKKVNPQINVFKENMAI